MKKNINKIAVFTSGGDAPGMNAAIRAVVRTAIYNDIQVYGVERGYDGMIKGDIKRLESRHVGNIIHRGGTMLRTARSEEFKTEEGRKRAYENLKNFEIDACVAIGGNGTFTGAKLFSETYDIPFLGIPGTIDNDLYGTDFTIGFDTAINTAMEAADRIRDTADSHDRLFFIEVMGRASGYIGLFTGIGAGAGGILIPEDDMDVEQLVEKLKKGVKRKKLFSLVVISEGNMNGGAYEIAEKVKEIYSFFDTKVTVIGHLQRGGSPSCADRVLASRLGYGAVLGLMNGESNKMVGIIDNELAYTSFDDAINKTKTFSKDLFAVASILGL